MRYSHRIAAIVVLLTLTLASHVALADATSSPATDLVQKVDFRYPPPWWQTCIGLVDDWQKTLIGKEGTLLYDFPGPYGQFRTRIRFEPAEPTTWVRQELTAPRVAIVRTVSRCGDIEITSEAFAVPPETLAAALPGKQQREPALLVQRLDTEDGKFNFAKPNRPCHPAFRSAATHWAGSIQYAFKAQADRRYTVALGFCEGNHSKPGQRVLDIRTDGKLRRTLDPVKEYGQNTPAVLVFDASDDNKDGWIDVEVAKAKTATDESVILNALWIFGDRLGERELADNPEKMLAGEFRVPPLAAVDCGGEPFVPTPRGDVVIMHLRNAGKTAATIAPVVKVESQYALKTGGAGRLQIGETTTLMAAGQLTDVGDGAKANEMRFKPVRLEPGAEQSVTITVVRGAEAQSAAFTPETAQTWRLAAETYWRGTPLPYDRFEIPDAGIQAVLDAAIRNIYQAREIKHGLPAFQVGPTCYRGLWVVDGSFLMEAVAYLGRTDEARSGIGYLMSFQRDNGAIMLIDGHWKETGIALWAVARHARLTGDKEWLASVWPKVQAGVSNIRAMRQATHTKPDSLVVGLIGPGFTDGGIGGVNPEYTNVYWTLIGLRAIAGAARWSGRKSEADAWDREYDDFFAVFREAAKRDMRTDPHGNQYLPIVMGKEGANYSPQRGQWGFLHAVFPGRLFAGDDPLVTGNMAMLRAVESEGLVFGTGWLERGIWNYAGSFYAHAWLWQGDGAKAADVLYAFANHASPLMAWREEQYPQGKDESKTPFVGDMPHNWASAEFVRLVRHLLVLERGSELHLLAGEPAAWAKPGMVTRVRDIPTDFGPMSLELAVAADGKTAKFRANLPSRTPPSRVVLHLESWAGRKESLQLGTAGQIEQEIVMGFDSR